MSPTPPPSRIFGGGGKGKDKDKGDTPVVYPKESPRPKVTPLCLSEFDEAQSRDKELGVGSLLNIPDFAPSKLPPKGLILGAFKKKDFT